MRLGEFTFELPESRYATSHRDVDDVRLMVVDARTSTMRIDRFVNLGQYLYDTDVLAINDSGIGPSRLKGRTDGGVEIEICFLNGSQPVAPNTWEALVLCKGDPPRQGMFYLGPQMLCGRVTSVVAEVDGSYWIEKDTYKAVRALVVLEVTNGGLQRTLNDSGMLMHPWYANLHDVPPGSLNPIGTDRTSVLVSEPARRLTAPIRHQLRSRGILELPFSLRMSVSWQDADASTSLADYRMYGESVHLPQHSADLLSRALREQRRVICIGTSAARALESVPSPPSAFDATTSLFISPGFEFKYCSALVTNLHRPKGSHLVMASAFGGTDLILHAYRMAMEANLQFGVHGDSMLIFRA